MAKTMTPRRLSRWAAWGLFGIVLLLSISGIVLQIAGCPLPFEFTFNGLSSSLENALTLLISIVTRYSFSLAFGIIGLLIIVYRAANPIGWVSLFFALAGSINDFSLHYGVCAYRGDLVLPAGPQVMWLTKLMSPPTLICFALFLMLFPDGHFLSSRWRRLTLILIAASLPVALLTLFWPGELLSFSPNPAPGVQNPFAFSAEAMPPWEAILLPLYDILLFGFVLIGFGALFLRWRREKGDVRQQIKLMTFYLVTAGTLFIGVELIGETVYPAIFDSWWYPLEATAFLVGFPIVFGLAIFKYRLYDIDLIIRRTLVYSLVTLTLLLVYFGSVILLQRLFTGVTDQQSPLAIVLSTLLIAALFNPLRRRMQETVDRRFYRRKYDAQQVLEQFANTARDETDMELLVAELSAVIQETLEPENLSVWTKR